MTIEEVKMGDRIQLNIQGKVDTMTAPELHSAILKAFQKSSNVIANFSEVRYVSSAGLRALLIGMKTAKSKGGSFVLTNVSDDVKDVFKVTGFANILTIE